MSDYSITEDKKPILELVENGFDGKRLIIIEAPPGAGKTFLSVLCAKRLIDLGKIRDNQKVLLMTFSRNARAQLNKEAETVFASDREELKQIEITNFHSFFQKYVWAYRSYLRLPLDLELVWPIKRYQQIRNALPELAGIRDNIIDALSSCLEFFPAEFYPPISFLSKKYKKYVLPVKDIILNLNKEGFIAHADLAYYFYLLLNKSPFVLETLNAKYPCIILDEYQDSSEFQDLIVRKLLGNKNKGIVFTDDMQMIHAWRGASKERINNLRKDYSYSHQELCELPRYNNSPALKLIFENLRNSLKNECFDPKIICYNSVFETIKINLNNVFWKKIKNLNEHVKKKAINSYIAKANILPLLRSTDKKLSKAILLPRNEEVNNLKRILREKHFPVKELSKGDNQHNFIGLLIENIEISSEQEKRFFVLQIMKYIDLRNRSSWNKRFNEIKKNPRLDIIRNKRTKDIRNTLKLDDIIDKSKNSKELLILLYHSVEQNKEELTLDWDIFQIFRSIIRKIGNKSNNELKKLFTNILLQEQYLMSYRILRGIYVLNIHQAKGKEFDLVVLPDVTESSFKSDNEDKRKLFYVAVTRSRRKVIIYSWGNQSKILDIFKFS